MNTLSEKALSFLADYCNSVDIKTFAGCDAIEQTESILSINPEENKTELIEALREIIDYANSQA